MFSNSTAGSTTKIYQRLNIGANKNDLIKLAAFTLLFGNVNAEDNFMATDAGGLIVSSLVIFVAMLCLIKICKDDETDDLSNMHYLDSSSSDTNSDEETATETETDSSSNEANNLEEILADSIQLDSGTSFESVEDEDSQDSALSVTPTQVPSTTQVPLNFLRNTI